MGHVTVPISLAGFMYPPSLQIPSELQNMNILNTHNRCITKQAPAVKMDRERGKNTQDLKSEVVAWVKQKEHLIFYSLAFSRRVANTTLPPTVVSKYSL